VVYRLSGNEVVGPGSTSSNIVLRGNAELRIDRLPRYMEGDWHDNFHIVEGGCCRAKGVCLNPLLYNVTALFYKFAGRKAPVGK
jgi:hypothetical protein